MSDRSSGLFVFGLGYTSLRFIELHGAAFDWVAGTVRSVEKAARLKAEGIDALRFDLPEAGEVAARATAVLVVAPPDEAGDPVLNAYGELLARMRRCRWLGYLSTTGVYGDCDGAWIDETAPVRPASMRSRQRAEAERAWLNWGAENGAAVQIFRLSGIYGPGRSAIDALRRGDARRIVKPEHVFNRIHVDDIAAVLHASMSAPRAGGIYNVSDDEPAPPQDVIACAAALLGIEPPPEVAFDDAGMSPMARSFYSENKRICNRSMKAELGMELTYPTYREGLKAQLRAIRV